MRDRYNHIVHFCLFYNPSSRIDFVFYYSRKKIQKEFEKKDLEIQHQKNNYAP
jgi:hypothetical protein